jgi:hypothetical protein
MISFDFLQFDQTNLLFFLLSAVGLVRERRILPFVIVVFANLVHGTLGAAMLAALVLWHRIDLSLPKTTQFKDAIGLFFIFIGIAAPDPVQSFAICMGSLWVSLSFGGGGLGIIPALLMLRQFVPHPPDFEILMGLAGLYWVVLEILRLTKIPKLNLITGILEPIFSLGILYGMKDLAVKWIEEPALFTIAGSLFAIVALAVLIAHFRENAFPAFYQKIKNALSGYLNFGSRLMPTGLPWEKEPEVESVFEIQASFDRLLLLTLLSLILLGVLFAISRGGLI